MVLSRSEQVLAACFMPFGGSMASALRLFRLLRVLKLFNNITECAPPARPAPCHPHACHTADMTKLNLSPEYRR